MNEEIVGRIAKAKAQQVTAATELWNARMEMLSSAGDVKGLLEHLRTPVELAGDNCGCNSACGLAEGLAGRVSQPVLTR